MTNRDFLERIATLSPKRLALLAVDLQNKLEAAQKPAAEPIAVISMACRFPGEANTPAAFWQLMQQGTDAITEIPKTRFDADAYFDADPEAPGKITTRWGGFVEDIDQFDPQLFGIAPREAVSMDPQQRLLLETAWETWERAGYAPDSLDGSPTGVFVGLCNSDYYQLLNQGGETQLDTYASTGVAHSVASGRLSYVFGLQGPSLSVDTACSSSLVALHLAVQSLRKQECRLALAGGVNAILSVETTISLSKGRMMAADGRCKAFDAAADGFVRSEGCGLVLLKRLADAQADGDPILAVIRGSAMNQDGRSNGITAPNGPSQEAVIRAALADAHLKASEVSYIETHGTGTSLGDPIEVQALGAVYGAAHSDDNPLMIGSVKTNIGHLESAAGIAGFIKLVLALQERTIPPHLHLTQPNPYINWEDYPIRIPTEETTWTGENGRLLGGLSSFGFSGTNVHLIVEAAPVAKEMLGGTERPLHLFTLSARSERALHQLADRFATHLAEQPQQSWADVAHTANVGRAQLRHRLALTAADTGEAEAALAAFAQGDKVKSMQYHAAKSGKRQPIVFLFTGQGAQYVEMGRHLYDTSPVFRATLEKCDALFAPYLDRSLLSIIYPEADSGRSLIDETAYTQPALFAIEYALAQVWRSWGIEPDVVLGHSIGEYAAACVAGVFSLEDAVKLVAERGRLMGSLPPNGAMAAVFGGQAQVEAAIAECGVPVSIAGVNGPEGVVISGEETAVQTVIAHLKQSKIRARRLAVSIGGHSALMEPILDAFEETAVTITYHPPQVEFLSSITGQFAGREVAQADYWRRQLRQGVLFYPAMQTLFAADYRHFLEIGPAPTLVDMGQRCEPPETAVWLPSLRPGHGDWQQMLTSLGNLFVQGAAVDWAGFDADYARRRLALPTYPFQRERYWLETTKQLGGQRPFSVQAPLKNPLLGSRFSSPALTDVVFETALSATYPAFLAHHHVHDAVILPSPAFIEMVLAAAHEVWGERPFRLQNFTMHEALMLSDDFQPVQTILSTQDGEQAAFQIVARKGDNWQTHVSGTVAWGEGKAASAAPILDIAAIQERCHEEIEQDDYYAQLETLGLEFGSDFRGLTHIWRRDGEALGRMILPDALLPDSQTYQIHPAFLDACFHLVGAPLTADLEVAYLLVGIEQFALKRPPGTQLWNHTTLRQQAGNTFTGDIYLYDDDGKLVAEARGLHLTIAGRDSLHKQERPFPEDWLYAVDWQEKPLPSASSLPQPESLAAAVSGETAVLADTYNIEAYHTLFPDLDALSYRYILEALRELGWQETVGSQVTTAELSGKLGIVPPHRRLFARLLSILKEEGMVQEVGEGWEVMQEWKTAVSSQTLPTATDLQTRYLHDDAELHLLQQCGSHLATILRGDQDPLQLLFPDGSTAATTRVYAETPFAKIYNQLVGNAVSHIQDALPPDRTLRILEIGAGTGSTTASVLPQLTATNVEYHFTDLSPLFLSKAQEKFATYPFMQYSLLDIEQTPAEEGQFDIIIAANVLHATPDLGQTLGHVAQRLAPGGLLLLLEGSGRQRWVDLTFGLTEGWWKFTDIDVRQESPLVDSAQWQALLAAAGFTAVSTLPANPPNDLFDLQTIYVAQRPQSTELASGSWLIFSDEAGVGAALAETIEAAGETAVLVTPGSNFQQLNENRYALNPANPADYTHLLETVSVQGILHLWSLETPPLAGLDEAGITAVHAKTVQSGLLLAQAVGKLPAQPPRLWFATQDAQPALAPPTNPLAAPMWGLGRVLALEHPTWWGGTVDLDASSSVSQQAATLWQELQQPDGEDQIAHRGGTRLVARLVRATPTPASSLAVSAEGSYLLTGGLGGLGVEIANWLAAQGARHLVLTSRQGLPPRDEWGNLPADSEMARRTTAVRSLEAQGVTVHIAAVDVADRTQMTDLFAQFGDTLPPLRGIIHAAVAMTSYPIAAMPPAALSDMLAAKVQGSWLLHQLSEKMALDFFVLFSSTTALWGVAGLGHYAAANQFMDSLAYYRQAQGLPAVSFNWGTWDVMRVASSAEQDEMARFGLQRMATKQALSALEALGAGATAQWVVADVDWQTLKGVYEAKRPKPFLSLVADLPAPSSAPVQPKEKTAEAPQLRQQLAGRNASERRRLVAAQVKQAVAQVLGIPAARLTDTQQGLFDMGMDSLMSVELKGLLETAVAQTLPSTLTFNYPTIDDLAEFLDTEILAAVVVAEEEEETAVVAESADDDDESTEIDDLSEDDLAAMLLAKLGNLD